jgi:Derlin-2/3
MSAMILAFTYTSCLDDRLAKAHFFIVTIPAPWIPLSMILLTMVMEGPYSAMVQTTGLIAAHLHYFLTEIWPTFGGGTNYIHTPAFIGRLFATTVPQVIRRAYGTAIRRPDQPLSGAGSGSSTGASSAVLPESWKSRGAGHRLGGD